MLAIVLKVLSILGIVLLAVLAVMLLALVLVMFFPFTYRLWGSKDAEGLRISVKVNWLFGLFRVRFCYPEPGHLTARALWFSLFDRKIPPEKNGDGAASGAPPGKRASRKAGAEKTADSKAAEPKAAESEAAEPKAAPRNAPKDQNAPKTEAAPDAAASPEQAPSDAAPAPDTGQPGGEQPGQEGGTGPLGKISPKIQGIKYTIYKIYDKIKAIWKNISYYIELLQEENTKQLAAHALFRAGRILRCIRPRRFKVRLLFGTGSPDTTGYLYGAYCVLSAAPRGDICLTPDFEEKRLEGEFDIAGRVLVWTFVINGLRLVMDKKLRIFLRRLKAGQKKLKEAAT